MNFNSAAFLTFLVVVYGAHLAIPRGLWKCEKLFLLAASYLFYAWWRADYAVLLLVSTAIDYACGRILARTTRFRGLALAGTVTANLALLGFFKYGDFVLGNVEGLASWIGLGFERPAWSFLLPIGISFYTFQSMSYSIDVYRRQLVALRSFADFALFVLPPARGGADRTGLGVRGPARPEATVPLAAPLLGPLPRPPRVLPQVGPGRQPGRGLGRILRRDPARRGVVPDRVVRRLRVRGTLETIDGHHLAGDSARRYSEILGLDLSEIAGSFRARRMNELGRSRREAGDLPGAVLAFSEAIRLAPEDPAPRANRGLALAASGALPGAVADLEAALAVAPPDWPLRGAAEEALRRAREESGKLTRSGRKPPEKTAGARVARNPACHHRVLAPHWHELSCWRRRRWTKRPGSCRRG